MSKLDLEWLSVFDQVYKTASVSNAAERLGMAQAAVSTALNKLREQQERGQSQQRRDPGCG